MEKGSLKTSKLIIWNAKRQRRRIRPHFEKGNRTIDKINNRMGLNRNQTKKRNKIQMGVLITVPVSSLDRDKQDTRNVGTRCCIQIQSCTEKFLKIQKKKSEGRTIAYRKSGHSSAFGVQGF